MENEDKKIGAAWAAAVAYKNALLSIGASILDLTEGNDCPLNLYDTELKSRMPGRKRWSFKGVSISRFISTSVDTLEGADVAHTDGSLAIGPAPTETLVYLGGPNKGKTGKEVLDKSGVWGRSRLIENPRNGPPKYEHWTSAPTSLTDVCPELVRALSGDLASLRKLEFAGLEWKNPICKDFHVTLATPDCGETVVANPVILFAGHLHATGNKDISSFVGYQNRTDDLGPIVVLGDTNYSVVMPMRK